MYLLLLTPFIIANSFLLMSGYLIHKQRKPKGFDKDTLDAIIANNKDFADGERWVTQPDGSLIKFGGKK